MLAANLPEATIYSPVGSTSVPCGDLGQGITYSISGQSAGSSMTISVFIVDVEVCVFSSYTLCAYFTACFFALPAFIYSSAFFQFTANTKSLSLADAFCSNSVLAFSEL